MKTRFHDPRKVSRALLNATRDPNMGAGIMCSGASGSGKTNISEWVAIEYIKRGWPILWFCPHGDSAKSLRRQLLLLPKEARKRVLYVRASDPNRVVSLDEFRYQRNSATTAVFYQGSSRISTACLAARSTSV